MSILRVGYVPEHFSSPLLQYADVDQGKTFTLTAFPGGTGAMISALQNDEIDVTIALTDALVAGIAKGSKSYKLVGSYVQTSLNWGVITGKNSKFQSIEDLRGAKIGISRVGSGSQTMAAVMAMKHGWLAPDGKVEIPEFQVNNDLKGLNASVNDGSTSAFLWEWFTTKPYVDSGEVRFIGSVLTPWPSWLIAAHPSPERADPAAVRNFIGQLTGYARLFDEERQREQADVDFIRDRFGYEDKDIRAWLQTVRWVEDCSAISGKVIADTLSILNQAGVVERPFNGFTIEDFVDHNVVRLID